MVLVVALHDAAVHADRLVDAPEIVLEHLTAAVEELDLVGHLGARRRATRQHLLQGLARAVLRVDAIEVLEGLCVGRIRREHEQVRVHRALDVAQLLLVDAREAVADLDAGLLVGALGEHGRQRVGELLPVLQRSRETIGVADGPLVERAREQAPLMPLERELRLGRAVLGDLRDAVDHVEALLGVVHARELDLLHRDEPLPVLAHPVERLEHLADRQRLHAAREEVLERRERGRVLGRGGEDLLVLLDRLIDLSEVVLVHLAEAELEVEGLLGAAGVLSFLLEDARELRPALGRRVEPIEALDRLGVRLLRREHAVVAGDRVLHVAELHLVDLRGAHPQLDELVGALRELVELGVVELGDLAERVQVGGQALDRRQRVIVGAVERKRARVCVERGTHLLQLGLVDLGDPVQELDLAGRILLARHLHLEHRGQPGELAELQVDGLEGDRRAERLLVRGDHRLEGIERRLVIRRRVEDAGVAVDRLAGVVQLVIPELGDAVAVRGDLVRIAREIRLALEDLEQLLPVAGREVQRVEALDRGEVVGVDLKDALVGVRRLRGVVQLALVDRADLEEEALLLVGIPDDVRLLRVDVEQLGPLLELQVQLGELVERRQLLGIDLEHLVVDGDRVGRTLEQLLVDRRGAEEVLLLIVRDVEHLALHQEDLGERLPLLAHLVEALERGGRAEVHRIDPEHAAVVADRGRGVVQRFLADLGGPHQVRGGQRRVRRRVALFRLPQDGDERVGALLVDPRERLGIARRRGQPLEALGGVGVRRIFGERARHARERGRRVVEGDLLQLRDAVQEIDALLRRAGVRRLDLEDLDQLPEFVRALVQRLEDLGDDRLVRRRREQALEGAERVGVAGIAIEDLAVDLDRRFRAAHAALTQRRET